MRSVIVSKKPNGAAHWSEVQPELARILANEDEGSPWDQEWDEGSEEDTPLQGRAALLEQSMDEESSKDIIERLSMENSVLRAIVASYQEMSDTEVDGAVAKVMENLESLPKSITYNTAVNTYTKSFFRRLRDVKLARALLKALISRFSAKGEKFTEVWEDVMREMGD